MIRAYFRIVAFELRRRLFSTSVFYGFERDLAEPFEPPPPRIRLSLRPFHAADRNTLLQPRPSMSAEALRETIIRSRMLSAGIRTCYVSVLENGSPCHMQWMIGPQENVKLHALTRGGLPALAGDEVLLENVFTLGSYQRMGIELWTVKKLFRMASESGARRAIVFVNRNNRVSIRMVLRMGFTPYLLKKDRYRWFRRRREFSRLPQFNGRRLTEKNGRPSPTAPPPP